MYQNSTRSYPIKPKCNTEEEHIWDIYYANKYGEFEDSRFCSGLQAIVFLGFSLVFSMLVAMLFL